MLGAVSPLVLAVIGLAACGGDVVVDDKDSTGSGGSGAAGPSGSGASAPAGTGAVGPGPSGTTGPGPSAGGSSPGGCLDHSACPPDSVCIFATGECAHLCQDLCDACAPGTICNSCATSSCPSCADCVGACTPIQKGQCDDDDACAPGSLCYFPDATCHAACSQFEPSTCPPSEACVGCATGSCSGCENCVDLCLPVFDERGR
ncbi:MAG: hypothetical protein WKG00_35480 [Polyangiaceae bacterium]